ncbi:MAG: hypothetical protein ACXU8N_21520 [Telluria sp.]
MSSLTSLSSSLPLPTLGSSTTPVARTADVSLAAGAAQLAGESSIVSLLGSTGGTPATYTAAGLLNAYATAGTAVPTESLDQQVLDSLSAAPAGGDLSALGDVSTAAVDANALAAQLLKAEPGAASTIVGDTLTQRILSTLG